MQYYKDKNCVQYAGASDLEPNSNICNVTNNAFFGSDDVTVYTKLLCTTSPKPRLTSTAGVIE